MFSQPRAPGGPYSSFYPSVFRHTAMTGVGGLTRAAIHDYVRIVFVRVGDR